jgi:hypothetical protein
MRRIPMTARVVGGVALLGGAYYLYRQHSASSVTNASSAASGANQLSSAPVNVQGVTDASGNLLPSFQWPYNQMALPYNYAADNVNGVNSYTSAQSGSFPGYQSTVVTSG